MGKCQLADVAGLGDGQVDAAHAEPIGRIGTRDSRPTVHGVQAAPGERKYQESPKATGGGSLRTRKGRDLTKDVRGCTHAEEGLHGQNKAEDGALMVSLS